MMVFRNAAIVTTETETFTISSSYHLDIRSMVSFILLNLALAAESFTPISDEQFYQKNMFFEKSSKMRRNLRFSMIFSNDSIISSIFAIFQNASTEKLRTVANAALAIRNESLNSSMESAWNSINAIDETKNRFKGNKTKNVLK